MKKLLFILLLASPVFGANTIIDPSLVKSTFSVINVSTLTVNSSMTVSNLGTGVVKAVSGGFITANVSITTDVVGNLAGSTSAMTINASSMTVGIPSTTTFNTTFTTCIPGSTITLTTGNFPVDLRFVGDINAGNISAITAVTVFIDGKFITGYSGTITQGIAGYATNALTSNTGGYNPFNFTFRTPTALSAASHTFCLSVATNASNGGSLLCDTVLAKCQFEAREVR